MRIQCAQMLQGTLGALSTVYNNARPAVLALMQNERVNTAVTNFSLIALGVVGNTIASWLGLSSLLSDEESFAKVYGEIRKKTENLLHSSSTDNDVKKSLIKAGLNALPKLDKSTALEIAVSLSDWIQASGICHEKLNKGEQRELNRETELSSCKKEKKNLLAENNALKDRVKDLSVDDAVCLNREKNCQELLKKCLYKGIIGRVFCWLN